MGLRRRKPRHIKVFRATAGSFELTEGVARVTAEEWIRTFVQETGGPQPSEQQMEEILRLASIAAHASERRAAPIACYLAGTTGRPVAELIAVAEGLGEPGG